MSDQSDIPNTIILHASCVALNGRAMLIRGTSGSGKSTLALDLIGFGATLVSDDKTVLSKDATGQIRANPADATAGLIEARHIGILRLPFERDSVPMMVVDLDTIEPARLPELRTTIILGCELPLLYRPPERNCASALIQCLQLRRDIP